MNKKLHTWGNKVTIIIHAKCDKYGSIIKMTYQRSSSNCKVNSDIVSPPCTRRRRTPIIYGHYKEKRKQLAYNINEHDNLILNRVIRLQYTVYHSTGGHRHKKSHSRFP